MLGQRLVGGTAQVVQPHQRAVVGLGQRVERQHALHGGQRLLVRLGRLGRLGARCQGLQLLGAGPLAGLLQPVRQAARPGRGPAGQQLARVGVARGQQLHIGRQGQHGVAGPPGRAASRLEPVQALAQIGAGPRLGRVGPQQLGQPPARLRPLQGQHGRQQPGLAVERLRWRAGLQQGRCAGQAQAQSRLQGLWLWLWQGQGQGHGLALLDGVVAAMICAWRHGSVTHRPGAHAWAAIVSARRTLRPGASSRV